MMSKQLLKDSLGWGLILWFIGYIMGIVFFGSLGFAGVAPSYSRLPD